MDAGSGIQGREFAYLEVFSGKVGFPSSSEADSEVVLVKGGG